MRVVFVVGTTASGKSDYALIEAQKNHGAIVNCDSIQVYQGLDIGSAKPTREEMARVPHYLYSFAPKGSKLTAGLYSREFFNTLEEIKTKYPVVYVVGGSGFYFQAIEKGMFPAPPVSEEIKQQILNEMKTPEGAARLYEEFRTQDPKASERIFPNDHYRLGRALELMRTLGRTLTEIQEDFEKQKKDFPYPLTKIGIRVSKPELLRRVQIRTEKMLKAGLVKEVQGLINDGYREWSALQSVGYKECLEYLEGRGAKDLKELEALIVQNTMQLAKKQRTWFQRDKEIQWIEVVA